MKPVVIDRTDYKLVGKVLDVLQEDIRIQKFLPDIPKIEVLYIEQGTRYVYWWRGEYYPRTRVIKMRLNRDISVYRNKQTKSCEFLLESIVRLFGHELYHHIEAVEGIKAMRGYASHKACDEFGELIWKSNREKLLHLI